MKRFLFYLKNFDWILFSAILLLLFFGLSEIYSVALSRDATNLVIFKKQIIFSSIGLSLFFLVAFVDYHIFRSLSFFIYGLGILLLILVLFFGKTVGGTTGWFSFGSFGIQPVEFVKIVLIVFLAKYFSTNSVKINPLKHLMLSGLGVFVLVALILKQPDFGSAMILFGVWGVMIALAGFKKRYILIIISGILIIFLSGWFFFFKDYQKDRLLTFVNPQADALGAGYNVTQAMIAVGSGGFRGRGLGFGSQSQLKFLPEAQNDFIFSVIAEELGFLGVFLVLLFFAIFFFRLLTKLPNIKDDFGVYFILGVVVLIFIEMFVNISMNIGILPVVGITLPLISYGGSSIVSTLILLGITESIIIRSKIKY